MPGKKELPIPFREAFARVLLHRAGLSVTDRVELHKELLDRELELALRVDGFAGDDQQAGDVAELPDDPLAAAASAPAASAAAAAGSASKAGGEGAGKGKGRGKGKVEGKSDAAGWSEDAEELQRLVRKLGARNPNICSEVFLKPFFQDLRLPGLCVSSLGEDVCKFSRLTSLDVSRNALTDIDNLPPTLKLLKAYNNQVSKVSCKATPSLCFLGLGHNPMRQDGLAKLARRFPNLMSLDLSFSELVSLEECHSKLQPLTKLRHLCLAASPVSLLPFYRLALLRELPQLQALDGPPTSDEELADAQRMGPASAEDAPAAGGEDAVADPAAAASPEAPEVAAAVPRPGRGGPGWIRIAVQLGELQRHRGLLSEALMPAGAEEPAEAKEGEAAAADEEVKRDPLSEICGQEGELRVGFELPDGSWVSTSKVKLAKKTYEVEEGEPPPPVVLKDKLKLKRLRRSTGEPLCFELDLRSGGLMSASGRGSEGAEVGLLQLHRWLQKGLSLKLFFVPAAPQPTPQADSEEAGEAPATGEGEGSAAGEVGSSLPPPPPPPPPPEEVELGGCVVPLESTFLRRTEPEIVTDAAREAGQLPQSPMPWKLEVHEAQFVPRVQWLHPETQVPNPNPSKTGHGQRVAICATLDLVVTLYAEALPAEELPESEEEEVAAPGHFRNAVFQNCLTRVSWSAMHRCRACRAGRGLVEKILQRHVVGATGPVKTGDFVSLRPWRVLTHDNSHAVIQKFRGLGAGKVRDPQQLVFALDHDIQNRSEANLLRGELRGELCYAGIEMFAREQGVDFYPAGRGIGHQVMVEELYAEPGSVCVASDSHSNMYGGVGCLGTPVVRTDAASIWCTSKTWWRVPPVAKVELKGRLPPGCSGKDVIIALCGFLNEDQVLNHAVEFGGEGVTGLSVEDRLTIANMSTEWGALCGLFPADSKTLEWWAQRAAVVRAPRPGAAAVLPSAAARAERALKLAAELQASPIVADEDAHYAKRFELDLDRLSPLITGGNILKSAEAAGAAAEPIKIHKAWLVSCVNARAGDIAAAAAELRGRKVAPWVKLYVAAASSEVQASAELAGDWQVLIDAGAIELPPGCGACAGLGAGTVEDGEVGIAATNRNFKGRMGSREGIVHLASPAVVAASAADGYITAPAAARAATSSGSQPLQASSVAREIRSPTSMDGQAAKPELVELVSGFPRYIEGEVLWCGADNISTDGIYHGRLMYEDLSKKQMADAAMENYDPEFSMLVKSLKSRPVLAAGSNFGTGSSREQAAQCLKYAGVWALIAVTCQVTVIAVVVIAIERPSGRVKMYLQLFEIWGQCFNPAPCLRRTGPALDPPPPSLRRGVLLQGPPEPTMCRGEGCVLRWMD
ncbi:unnamed protein product [Polarella glacialis]|uniref:Homoaconitase, mitochondrial n=1 Tax=Polarella glacialis TaxID=89957 RepID=A0A813JG11_POLGL|nr:unnamed protein product [Polarella glacialis]